MVRELYRHSEMSEGSRGQDGRDIRAGPHSYRRRPDATSTDAISAELSVRTVLANRESSVHYFKQTAGKQLAGRHLDALATVWGSWCCSSCRSPPIARENRQQDNSELNNGGRGTYNFGRGSDFPGSAGSLKIYLEMERSCLTFYY